MLRTLLILVSVFLFVLAVALKETGFHFLGASPPPVSQLTIGMKAVGVGLLYYVLTLAGIAAGVIFEALSKIDDDKSMTWTQVKSFLLTARSWRGLIASPLIFLTVYMGVASNPIAVPFILLAFQNGFFWKAAMSRLAGA
jgi:hypothetical protein